MNADVVVIGAGIIGSSIALELGRAGLAVVVVDKSGGAGHGSTSASSAVVRFNFSTAAGVATSWEAKQSWANWRDHIEGTASVLDLARYRRTGLAMLDTDAAPRQLFRPHLEAAGVPYEEWDSGELMRRVPGIDVGRYGPPSRLDDERFWAAPHGTLGAVFTPDSGFVDDPVLASRNLATAAQGRGVRFLYHRTVVDIGRRHGRVSGVRLADGEVIEAPIVVNAAGPWSSAINRLAGVGSDFTVDVRPMRQEVHHVPAPAGYNPDGSLGIAVADLDLGTYVRPESGDGMLVGGTEPECDPLPWIDDPDGIDVHPTKEVFAAQVTRAARRFPNLRVPNRPKGVVGVYDVTDDWTPIYDRTDLPGFYVAIGTSGNQFKNAPVVGQFMASIIDAVENGSDHDADPVLFVAQHTGASIDLGAFSRKRARNADSSGTVMG